MLVLSRKPNESIMIGDNVEITLLGIQGNKIRLGINAPADVPVHRREVYEQIAAEKQASHEIVCVDNFYTGRRSNITHLLTVTGLHFLFSTCNPSVSPPAYTLCCL